MRANHLSEDRLIELCILDTPSSVEQQHLSTCARCDARRARVQRLLEGVSDTAAASADAAFPLERLNRQQARILPLQFDRGAAKWSDWRNGKPRRPDAAGGAGGRSTQPDGARRP